MGGIIGSIITTLKRSRSHRRLFSVLNSEVSFNFTRLSFNAMANRTELGCLITDLSQCIKSKTMNDVTLFVFPEISFQKVWLLWALALTLCVQLTIPSLKLMECGRVFSVDNVLQRLWIGGDLVIDPEQNSVSQKAF